MHKFTHEQNVVFIGPSMHRPGDTERLMRACQTIGVWRGKSSVVDIKEFYEKTRGHYIKRVGKLVTKIPWYRIDAPDHRWHGYVLEAFMLSVDGFLFVPSDAKKSENRPPGVFFPVMFSELEPVTRRGLVA